MIAVYIRFEDGSEMYRQVYRVDLSKDKNQCYIWDTPETPQPEQVKGATVQVYIGGNLQHTYRF